MKVQLRSKSIILQSTVLAILIASVVNWVIMRDSRAAPVDDSRMMQLEQEVRGLQRLVDQQARRLDALENAIRQPRVGRAPTPVTPVENGAATTAWLKSANWDKLRPGMSDAEVVSVLGPSTTARKSGQGQPESGATQTLFYSLELDAGGFLSGQVIVVDHRVLEVHKPTLR